MVVLLCTVTLTLYGFYWIPKLGLDVNRVIRREKYSFGLMLVLGILTLGLALAVFETLFAYDLQKSEEYRALPRPNRNLGGVVLALNVVAILLSVLTAGLGLIVSIVLGIWATWLIQDGINQLALTKQEEPAVQPLIV
jgi:hypothetical protein